ncbi:hypothetical protein PsorP6_015098 [Peronosclerospora sorghi]|uniref:Uncharacterized protein n=1 Tax=Peronosclerospora sorghi TaxID=230839 RepID=A0ACC0VS67_9STRA|nr:hypothetical protein PsorP6_015098 [Peronosclerospora sorghi]
MRDKRGLETKLKNRNFENLWTPPQTLAEFESVECVAWRQAAQHGILNMTVSFEPPTRGFVSIAIIKQEQAHDLLLSSASLEPVKWASPVRMPPCKYAII